MFVQEEVHLNSRLHKIVEILKKEDREYTFSELSNITGINVAGNARLIEALKKNPRIHFTGDMLRFVPLYNIRSVEDLEEILRGVNRKEGIEMSRLCDSPKKVSDFLDELKKDGKVIIIKDMDGSEIVFYNDMHVTQFDSKITSMWNSIKVPNYHDVIEELNSVGLQKGETVALKKRKQTKKSLNKRQRMRIKITNTHVKELDLQGMNDME